MGVIYPDIINTIIQLEPLNDPPVTQQCSDNTTCTVVITRGVYRVTVIQSNDIGDTSTDFPEDIDSKMYCRIFITDNYIPLHSKNIDCY